MSESGEVDSEPEIQNGHLQVASYGTHGDHLQPLHNNEPMASKHRYNEKKLSHSKSRNRGRKRHHKRSRSSSRSSSSSTSSTGSSSSYSNSSSSSSSNGKHKYKKRSRNKRSRGKSEGPHSSKHKSSKNGNKSSDKNEKGTYVVEYLANEFKCRKNDAMAMSRIFRDNMDKVRQLLIGKSAKAHYSKSIISFKISDVTNDGADRIPAYIKAGTTVAKHFQMRHKLVLVHPSWPCLVGAGGGGHRSYYPIEVMYLV
ncbi:hypothetical protein DdX_01664 [Ditylenchus destructor]|uniref:PAZ domain-containing protein n=1 Tax=Ditylenchus destructor TaxID=166010 RepID=A0AAD4RBD3_9BILA|nr:hypothetical protein DdX_01664 [Ditylenchus destructor]